MQVFDNVRSGKCYMLSNVAAVEFKRGDNPLDINMLVQLDAPVARGCGRWSMQWYARHMTHVLGVDEDASDAVCVLAWNVDSIAARADEDDCPDLLDTDDGSEGRLGGHLGILCRILQSLSQGLTVAVQGTSAGLPT